MRLPIRSYSHSARYQGMRLYLSNAAATAALVIDSTGAVCCCRHRYPAGGAQFAVSASRSSTVLHRRAPIPCCILEELGLLAFPHERTGRPDTVEEIFPENRTAPARANAAEDSGYQRRARS
jgi:hypothetical protein